MEHIPYQAINDYCSKRIRNYEQKVSEALDIMDEMRCPLDMADGVLYDKMTECISQWCDENEIPYGEENDIDPEEVIFNSEPTPCEIIGFEF